MLIVQDVSSCPDLYLLNCLMGEMKLLAELCSSIIHHAKRLDLKECPKSSSLIYHSKEREPQLNQKLLEIQVCSQTFLL